tara:strand:+ start:774 stop:1145 length:372 start_codon:yes stop_codon:yes gene_type:complete
MKKLLIIILTLYSFNTYAIEMKTTFNSVDFQKAQLEGKTVVINSWNKFCTTCKSQIKILNQVQNQLPEVLFLSFEQEKDKDTAKQFGIDYWTTIVIFKNNKEVYRSIGQTNKNKIYTAIKSSL